MLHYFTVINVVNEINKVVCDEDITKLMSLLKSSALNLSSPLHIEESHLYMRLLKKQLNYKDGQNLWYDDVVKVIEVVDSESREVKTLTEALVHLNLALVNNDVDEFMATLSSINNIDGSYKDIYYQTFLKAYKKKGHNVCPWVVCHTEAGNTVYIDIESYTYSWSTPKDFVPYARYISKKDIHSIVEKIYKHHINKFKQMEFEKCLVKIQAHCKGYLFRRNLYEKFRYFENHVNSIVKIQSWWRKVRMVKKYGTVIKMKAIEATLRLQKKQNPLAWYKIQVILLYLNFLCIVTQ